MPESKSVFRRIILKISGEGLAGPDGYGLGTEALAHVVDQIRQIHDLDVEAAVVVGGGNILRGETFARKSNIAEATAHHMGMLATVINALALRDTFEAAGIQARVLSSIPVTSVCEPFVRRRCIRHLEKGLIVILAGGTGRPFVTTDTAAALAAAEIKADVLIKATQVDGVYSTDPKKDPDAKFYSKLSYDRVIDERLKVMDISAVDLCQQNNVPIIVFNLHKAGNLKRIINGESIGTVVSK